MMKNKEQEKSLSLHWWFWLIISFLFLLAVQILFSIPAPVKWLDAVWEAGDFISFCGTVVLGFVAWKQSKMASKTSDMLIRLQAAEYQPTIALTGFVGVTKFAAQSMSDDISNNITLAEMQTKDNELRLGYAVNLIDDNFDKAKPSHCRTYELHLKYFGKAIISSPKIVTIQFIGDRFSKSFNLGKTIDVSLINEESLELWIFVISNEDFLEEGTNANRLIRSSKLAISFELETLTHDKYIEVLEITKHFVAASDKSLNITNTERAVSAQYQIS